MGSLLELDNQLLLLSLVLTLLIKLIYICSFNLEYYYYKAYAIFLLHTTNFTRMSNLLVIC